MSINWVMVPPTPNPSQPFTPLPSEQTLWVSPPRTSLNLSTVAKFPASQPFSLTSSTGALYLTSKRVIYLPASPTPDFQSFAAPLLNLQDSHVSAPWIGPNVWTALVRPVQGGNLPNQALEAKVTFKDGGAYDFQTRYERVRERVVHAVELARERGQGFNGEGVEEGRGRGPGVMEGVDVVLEDLPRYEEAQAQGAAQTAVPAMASPHLAQGVASPPAEEHTDGTAGSVATTGAPSRDEQIFTPPDEPPPGYDQVQREAIEDEFSRRLNQRLAVGDESESR
ncbi:hypothetical protein CAC42_3511 [Sphaceloma murrayae]|uniref:Uncharacterized protein n=1 Tax=Sphaceloma murrayae TaxID=2082308 RepID=A0A2K1R1W0_9PEZI|nr:hypothetical protein CAC42_3511 [Sphaceloma murrayae]